MWILRILKIPQKAKKSQETVLKEADTTRSLTNKTSKPQVLFLQPCDEKSETGSSCDNRNDQGKTLQGKAATKEC